MPIEYLSHTGPSGLYICVDFILTAPWHVCSILLSHLGVISIQKQMLLVPGYIPQGFTM